MMRCVCRIGMLLLLVLLTASLSGCAKYRAKSVFDEAEELLRAEQYDQAVEKYFAAAEGDPSNMTYKMKLAAGRTRAAAFHIRKGRELTKEEKFQEALEQYRLAQGFDPSLGVAALEEKQVQNLLSARTLVEEGFAHYREKRFPAARQAVVEVLRLDPQSVRGQELKKLLDERIHTVVLDGIELDVASDEPVTLRFRQTSVREAFTVLSRLSGINFILDEEVKGKPITVLLEKGTFAQALELILQMGGVEKKVLNSKTILIYPNSKDKLKQYQDQVIQTFYLSHIDAKKAINLLRTMLQLRKVYVHEERNALVIRDTPEVIRLAEQIIKAADRADSEVLFDVEVLAVRDGDTLNIGPKLSNYGTKVGFAEQNVGDTNISVIPDNVIVQSLNRLQTFYTVPSITFDFAKTLSSTEILAAPKIRVKNNEKAKIHIGNRDPVVTTTIIAGTDQSTQNVQYVDSGIKLDIEPNVQLDGTVLAKVTLEVSNAQRLNANDTTGTSPVALTTTNAQTSLVLVDGVRTILGGLYETNVAKNKSTFPLLGDIPLIGSLLTSFDNSETRREILLSITPYVVKRVEIPEVNVATIWSGGEDTLSDGPKFGAFVKPLLSEVESTVPEAAPALRPAPSRPVAPAPFPGAAPPEMPALPEDSSSMVPPLAAPAGVPGPEPAAVVPPMFPPAVPGGESVPETLLAPAPISAAGVPTGVDQPASTVVAVATEAMPAPAAVPGPPMPPSPQAPARLKLTGSDHLAVGQELTLTVAVDSVDKLYSAPLFVNYDPALIEFVGGKEGAFLGQGGQATVFSMVPRPSSGQVVVGYKQGPGGSGASGGGTLFTLNFRGKAAGNARVEVNRVNFRDPAGTRLDVEPAALTIIVK